MDHICVGCGNIFGSSYEIQSENESESENEGESESDNYDRLRIGT